MHGRLAVLEVDDEPIARVAQAGNIELLEGQALSLLADDGTQFYRRADGGLLGDQITDR